MTGLEELTAHEGSVMCHSSQCGQASHALPTPAPASGTLILIHKEPYCGEREKKKMTIVNLAKVAGPPLEI